MRPPKPRISKPRLVWKWSQSKGAWEPYHRVTWVEGQKKRQRAILLRWEGDSQTLDELYWKCERGEHDRQQSPRTKYTWGNLVEAWRKDPRIQGKLSAGTKASYRREMDFFLAKNREKDVRKTTRAGVRKIHDKLAPTPRKADKVVATIKLLWNYGVNKLDWPLGPNPAAHIELFGPQREFEPWPDWLIEKISDAPPVVQSVGELILGTGQRPNAAILMKHSDFLGDTMRVTDEKGNETYEIHCPERLRAFIEAASVSGEYVIAKNLREPLGYSAVEKRFRAWRKGIGKEAMKFSLHGLRKNAIIQMAEAGCSDAEIQAVTNQSAEMVAFYRKKASRKILSKMAAERNKTKT